MLQVERFFRQVERRFDIAAVFGNYVEGNFVFSTKTKQIAHVQCVSSRLYRKNDISRKTTCSTLLPKSATKSKVASTKSERCVDTVGCCFNVVAGVDGALCAEMLEDHHDYRWRR